MVYTMLFRLIIEVTFDARQLAYIGCVRNTQRLDERVRRRRRIAVVFRRRMIDVEYKQLAYVRTLCIRSIGLRVIDVFQQQQQILFVRISLIRTLFIENNQYPESHQCRPPMIYGNIG